MKIALLIAGYLRSFKHNIKSLKKYLLDNHDVDIYLHVTTDKELKYNNADTDINMIQNTLKPKLIIINQNMVFKDCHNNNLYNQNYKYYLLNKNKNEIEKVENIKYDLVVKLRPDVNLLQPLLCEQIDDNTIYIPRDAKIEKNTLNNKNENYICDIIAFGKPDVMNKYFDLFNHLDCYKNFNNNETILYHYLNNENINYKLIDIEYIVLLSSVNVIAISGDSGSGKTCLSNILQQKLFKNSFILECDRYHKWERNNTKWNSMTHLNPEANFLTKMNEDVFDLKIGNDIYQIDYDHNTGKFTDKTLIENKENIIVCGLHTLYLNEDVLNLKIFVETEDNIRINWKIQRDISKRGYNMEKIVKQIEDRKEDYKKYIHPQKNNADLIVNYYSIDTNPTNYWYKIGINKIHDLNNFIQKLSIKHIENEDLFNYLHFDNDHAFEDIIINVIMCFFNTNIPTV